MLRKFVLLLCCFAASPVAAGEVRLTGEAIKTTLGGSLLALDTPIGSTVSVRIGHNGLMSGEAGTALGAVLGAAKDRGRWWVASDQVCFKWFRWFDAKPRCATISVDGKRFSWRREDGDTGTGTIVEAGKPIAKPAVVVAEAKKPAAHKPSHKAREAVAAATAPKAEAPAKAEIAKAEIRKPASAPEKQIAKVAVPQKAPEQIAEVLRVPAPRPAVRPRHHDKITVASVKPQFFNSAIDHEAKVQPAKVTTIAKIQPSATVSKPFRVAGVDPSDVLNIRTGPSPDYQAVGGIPSDSHGITITGPCRNDWCPVRHRMLVGWVNRHYLAEETAANAAGVSELNYWEPVQ